MGTCDQCKHLAGHPTCRRRALKATSIIINGYVPVLTRARNHSKVEKHAWIFRSLDKLLEQNPVISLVLPGTHSEVHIARVTHGYIIPSNRDIRPEQRRYKLLVHTICPRDSISEREKSNMAHKKVQGIAILDPLTIAG